jgi:hypothetical protein
MSFPRLRRRIVVLTCVLFAALAATVRANEIWVAPTLQTDTGGLGVGNGIWPVSPLGVTRLVVAVPDDLQTFQGAKIVLIPKAPAGAGVLHLHVCTAEHSDMVNASCSGPSDQPFTGVVNQLIEVDISTALAPSVTGSGARYIAVAAYTTPTFTTDHIVGMRFAYVPTAPAGVATLGANTFTGTQMAPAFVGDGSALTNVSANLFDGLDSTAFASVIHAHNVSQVTNAARLNGGNFFEGNQSVAGDVTVQSLELGQSSPATAHIKLSSVRFLHSFGGTFVGGNSGNFTMSGFGDNTGLGGLTLVSNVTGYQNTAVAREALFANTSGSQNTAVGAFALRNNTTGESNLALGTEAGNNATTGSFNIYLGAFVSGAAGESNTMYLGKVGTQTKTLLAGVRGITTGAADAIPVVIDSNGQLGTISSSRRFKEDIQDVPASLNDRLLRLRPVTFRYTQAYADGSKPIQYGLVAEEVAEVFPELAVRNSAGEIETVHYETLNVLLLRQFQEQQREIELLKQQMRELLTARAR